MKSLCLILSFLMTTLNAHAVFDTISSISTITSIQVLPGGTKVSLKDKLNLSAGHYVLALRGVPKGVLQEDIHFEDVVGLSILKFNLEREEIERNGQEFSAFKGLNEEIERISANIKALDAEERALLKEKKENQVNELAKDKRASFADYFHMQGTSIREQRRAAYKQLIKLREEGKDYTSRIKQVRPEFKESKQNVFITFVLLDSLNDELNWNYFIRAKARGKQKDEWKTNEKPKNSEELAIVLPAFVNVRGQVIENQHQAPIIFASVQFYQKGKLISSTATDYNGKFSLPLATNETYDMVISFNGYKKKRFKKIHLNQASVPEQVIRMEVKHKISALEIVAYALPIIDMINFMVK